MSNVRSQDRMVGRRFSMHHALKGTKSS